MNRFGRKATEFSFRQAVYTVIKGMEGDKVSEDGDKPIKLNQGHIHSPAYNPEILYRNKWSFQGF